MTLVKFNNRPQTTPLNHFFDDVFSQFPTLNNRAWHSNRPPVNISESTNAYHVELHVPGRNKEDFKVNIEKGLLTVSFDPKDDVKSEDVKFIHKEFSFTGFKRSFSLDDKVDLEKIEAKYENGLLKFNLPKLEEVKQSSRQISIQ